MRIRFGDFQFDGAARELLRDGRSVDLSPKALNLLALLLAGRPRALPKAELHDRLWPRTFVSHTSLPRLITELRKALGDPAGAPRFIRTVHGHGYAFCGEANDEVAGSRGLGSPCALLRAGREVPLLDGENLIGRAPDCAVRSRSGRVSRRHARIRVDNGRATIEDLGSRNGTFVEGRRVTEALPLADGDTIAVGPEVMVFLSPGEAGSTEEDGRSGHKRLVRPG